MEPQTIIDETFDFEPIGAIKSYIISNRGIRKYGRIRI